MHSIVCHPPLAQVNFYILPIVQRLLTPAKLLLFFILSSCCLPLGAAAPWVSEAHSRDTLFCQFSSTGIESSGSAVLTGSGPSVLCSGGMSTFSLDFSAATGPFQFIPVVNGVAQTPVMSNAEPVFFSLPISTGDNAVSVTAVDANGCAIIVTDTVHITGQAPPTATITGGGDLCLNGPGDTLTVSFTGTGPFTFVYSIAGIAQTPITTSLNPFKIPVNPAMYTKYRLVSVTANGCPGTVSGMVELFVYVSSSASLGPDLVFCDNLNTTLQANLTGTAPFTLTYAINGVTQPQVTVQEGPVLIPVNISATTTYQLISIESPGCLAALTDAQVVTINYAPTYSNVTQTCNPATGNYILEFDILGGTPPYTLLSGSGSFSGNHFTSTAILQSNAYSFTFRDANNCGDVMVSGPNTCNCVSMAGTMNTAPLDFCVGATATAIYNGGQMLDGDDTLRFILHTLPGFPTGQILAWSDTPSFPWMPGIQAGVTYYISAIAGNNAGNGTVDLSDICLSVAVGTPVQWHNFPTAMLTDTVNICAGTGYSIPVNFTGTGPFNLSYTVNGGLQSITGLTPPFNITGTAIGNTRIILTSVEDAFCENVTDRDTGLVVAHPPVVVGPEQIACDYFTGDYILDFQVLTGDFPTIMIAGSTGAYNPVTGHFTADVMPQTTPYFFEISDSWQCGTDTISGIADCNCITDAGVLGSDTLHLCYGAKATGPTASGTVLLATDTLIYILTDNPDPISWTILAQSDVPEFDFIPGTTIPGTTYYILAVAGAAVPSGVDWTGACLAISDSVPVVWMTEIGAVIMANTSICTGSSALLTIELFGASAFSYTVAAMPGISVGFTNDTSLQNTLTVFPTQTTIYTIENFVAGGCPLALSSQATVTVNPIPEIVPFLQTCDNANLNYILEFGISNGVAANPVYTVTDITGSFLQDTFFVSTSYPAGSPYTFTVSDPIGCSVTLSGIGNCGCATKPGIIFPVVTGACLDGTVSVMASGDAVLDPNDTIRYLLCTDPAILPSGILQTNTSPVFSFVPPMVGETEYYAVAVVGNQLPDGTVDWSDPCTVTTNSVPVIFHSPPQLAVFDVDTAICQGMDFQIPISLSGTPPFKFRYKLNGNLLPEISTSLPAFIISTTNIQQDQVYEMVSVRDKYCTNTATGTIRITALDQPRIFLNGEGNICPGDSVFLSVRLENADSALVQITGSNGEAILLHLIAGDKLFGVAPLQTTTFTLGNIIYYGNDCPGTVSGMATVNVSPLSITPVVSDFNGSSVSCNGEADGSIQLTTSGGGGTYTYVWENGSSSPGRNNLTAGFYACTISDQKGCSDSLKITLSEPLPLATQYTTGGIRCAGDVTGVVQLDTILGGTLPYHWAFENGFEQDITDFPTAVSGLTAGDYSATVTDENGCVLEQAVQLSAPNPLIFSIGNDQEISLGDSIFLETVILSGGAAAFEWKPAEPLLTPDFLYTWAKPLNSTVIQLTITDFAGCKATEEMTIRVRRDNRIYVPNIFAPGTGGENEMLTVFGGAEVTEVNYFQVYDRWGELLFERRNIAPNDRSNGWDGRCRNKLVAPGVYVYITEVLLIDGRTAVFKGDVTVAR